MRKKYVFLLIISLVSIINFTKVEANSNITTNPFNDKQYDYIIDYASNQVPSDNTNYWTSWRQVKTVQPIQIQQINYLSKNTINLNYGAIETLPIESIIYVKGYNLENGDPRNMYFEVAKSMSDPIVHPFTSPTQSFWAMNVKNFKNISLTNNNDQIKSMNFRPATVNRFTNQFKRGYLNPTELEYDFANQPVLSPTYKQAIQYYKAVDKIGDAQESELFGKTYHKAKRYIINAKARAPKIKSVEQPLWIRHFKGSVNQVKLKHKIYYVVRHENGNNTQLFTPYNTVIGPFYGVASSQKPTQEGISHIVIPHGTNLRAFKGTQWTTTKITKLGKFHDYYYTYDGNNWISTRTN